MPSITGGRVSFSRTVQPAQYESARAEAELSFVLEGGEDPVAVLREWGQKVRGAVLEMVGQSARTTALPEDPGPPARNRFRRRTADRDEDIPL